MTSSVVLSLIAAVCFFAGSSYAIQCFTCQDKTANCVTGIMTSCSPLAQFCKLEWTAATDMTAQSCATSTDCPAATSIDKRQAGKSLVGADGSSVADINNCCNYDGCNCVGPQCDSVSVASTTHLDILTLVFAAVLFLLY